MKIEDRLFIHEEVTDWFEDFRRREIEIKSEEDVIAAIQKGIPTSELARDVIVATLLGDLPPEVLPPMRSLTAMGAQARIVSMVHKIKTEVEIKSGTFSVNTFIGDVDDHREDKDEIEPEDVGEGSCYVNITDPEATPRIESYLLRRIPGHVITHLVKYKENGGDVREIAEELIAKIREIVDKIV
jgi:hypothetical protein